jgi:hypothetical protein
VGKGNEVLHRHLVALFYWAGRNLMLLCAHLANAIESLFCMSQNLQI